MLSSRSCDSLLSFFLSTHLFIFYLGHFVMLVLFVALVITRSRTFFIVRNTFSNAIAIFNNLIYATVSDTSMPIFNIWDCWNLQFNGIWDISPYRYHLFHHLILLLVIYSSASYHLFHYMTFVVLIYIVSLGWLDEHDSILWWLWRVKFWL
jgi:hypothetical protein